MEGAYFFVIIFTRIWLELLMWDFGEQGLTCNLLVVSIFL
jgi:hypothetical protein